MEVSDHLHAPADLPVSKQPPVPHWRGGWVGPKAVLDAEEKKKILPLPGIEPRPSIPQPVDIPIGLSRLTVLQISTCVMHVFIYNTLHSESDTTDKESGQLGRYTDWVTAWATEELRFYSRQRQEMYLLAIALRTALGPSQTPVQWT
jgi:hypothetical protein